MTHIIMNILINYDYSLHLFTLVASSFILSFKKILFLIKILSLNLFIHSLVVRCNYYFDDNFLTIISTLSGFLKC